MGILPRRYARLFADVREDAPTPPNDLGVERSAGEAGGDQLAGLDLGDLARLLAATGRGAGEHRMSRRSPPTPGGIGGL